MFLPIESSPQLVEAPSAITSPASILSPSLTIGFWLIHVSWLERTYFINVCKCCLPAWSVMIISSPVTRETTPLTLAQTTIPESFATLLSIPVPTTGLSVIRSGTD